MAFKNLDIIDVISDVVDSMRTTGTYTGVFGGTNTACASINNLSTKDVITINNTDFKIIANDSTSFTVKGDVSAFTTYKTKAPYFEYGHAEEVADTLSKKDGSIQLLTAQKYPLIWLMLDRPSTYNPNLQTFDYKNVKIYIVNFTKSEYKANKRKEINFEPILHPTYESFIEALRRSRQIDQRHNNPYPPHDKVDRYNWGSGNNKNNTKTVFNDYLDAVEIFDLDINVINTNCKI